MPSKRTTTQKTRQNIRAKTNAANDNLWDRCRARFFPSFLQGLTWRRLWVGSLVLFVLLWGGMIIIAGELHTKTWQQTEEKIVKVSASHGFTVQDIMIEGRKYISKKWLQDTLASVNGAPLFGVRLASLSDQLIENPWIKAAHVKRIWPDKIKVSLWERTPTAIKIMTSSNAKNNMRYVLLDDEGTPILTIARQDFPDLPLIKGKNAEKNALSLISILKAEPSIYTQLNYVEFVSERRWNIILQNGIEIKLPENDIGLAIRKLAIAQEQQALLSQPLTAIDMRDTNRIVLEMKKGKNREFELTGEGEAL